MTTAPDSAPRLRGGDFVSWGARLILGGVFVYMGLSKVADPVGFLKLVREYGILEAPLALNLVAATLPWLEITWGLLLLLGIAVRGTAALLFGVLVVFTAAIVQRALSLQSSAGIAFCAVAFDCGCGGGEVAVCRKLLENVALMWLAGVALVARSSRLCLRHRLFARTG